MESCGREDEEESVLDRSIGGVLDGSMALGLRSAEGVDGGSGFKLNRAAAAAAWLKGFVPLAAVD